MNADWGSTIFCHKSTSLNILEIVHKYVIWGMWGICKIITIGLLESGLGAMDICCSNDGSLRLTNVKIYSVSSHHNLIYYLLLNCFKSPEKIFGHDLTQKLNCLVWLVQLMTTLFLFDYCVIFYEWFKSLSFYIVVDLSVWLG